MHSRRLVLASATASLALLLTGCGSAGSSIVDAAKSQASSAVSAAACKAIPEAQTKVSELGTVDPATLEKVNSAVDAVSAR